MHRVHAITATVFPAQAGPAKLTAEPCSSHFEKVFIPKPDSIFATAAAYKADKFPDKVNLGIGAYRTDDGKPYVLNVVKQAQIAIANDPKYNREYLPITGDAEFATAAAELMFGDGHPLIKAGLVASAQTLSGTGALRIASDFCSMFLPGATAYVSNPTWGNHQAVFGKSGVKCAEYRYWCEKKRGLDFKGMCEDIRAAPNGSVILLHVTAHNPTGVDPTPDQWIELSKLMKEKNHFPFFDCAYQGFASGNLEKDAFAPRYFADQGFEMLVCQSFAKNLGLYNARVGGIHFVAKTKDKANAVKQQIAKIVRPNYSNPPADGARIAKMILKDPTLRAAWEKELSDMSNRIIQMRGLLRGTLEKLGTPGDWSHITTQIGMFTYTGLSVAQCKVMKSKHHVYLLDTGRVSMAGVNSKNVEYIAKAIDDVVRNN